MKEYEVRSALEEALTGLPLMAGSHFSGGTFEEDPEYFYKCVYWGYDRDDGERIDVATAERIIAAVKSQTKLDEWIKVGSFSTSCFVCGERDFPVFSDGIFLMTKGECNVKYEPYKAKISVPSGKLLFTDDLRELLAIPGNFDVNSFNGQKKTFEAYAQYGMAHGFVSNTCPTIRQKNRREVYITDTYKHGKDVGGICTDLWWYSVMDLELAKKLAEDRGLDWKYVSDFTDIVTVKPGVYEVTHYYPISEKPFASFIYVEGEECFEPKNTLSLNVTAGQIVAKSLINYPDLYCIFSKDPQNAWKEKAKSIETMTSDEFMEACKRVADHVFMSYGNGFDWHPNGWSSDSMNICLEENPPSVEIPEFTGPFNIYPLSEKYSDFCQVARGEYPMNESFAKLAMNIGQCCIKYGITGHRQRDVSEELYEKIERDQLSLITECFYKIADLYPQWVPDYCKDLLEQERPERIHETHHAD